MRIGLAISASILLVSAAPAPRYHVVHGWPVLPEGRVLGPCSGVAVDARGNVFVLHRGQKGGGDTKALTPIAEPVVEVFDGRSGKLLREWGANRFVTPHGISIGADGTVWITDTALNQVFAFDQDGKLLRTLGERGVAGTDQRHFDRPTDVAPVADGAFYVADGYGNARILKYAADGRLSLQWGTHGAGPGQFAIPHALALDAAGNVLVADRGNERIQRFDPSGRLLGEWKDNRLGRPFGIAILPGGSFAVVDGGNTPATVPDHGGVTVIDRRGRIVERFGRIGNYDGQLWVGHDIAADRAGNIYVVDITGQRVQKFTRR